MEEFLEIYDEKLNKIGIEKRSVIHATGLLHAVCHLWITDIKNGLIYFQVRSMDKDSYPGYYDISSAGHIDVGETPTNAMIREASEEIGISISKEKLDFLGTIIEYVKDTNHEISYIYTIDIHDPIFHLGPEVTAMESFSIEDFINDTIDKPRCPHNVDIVKTYLKQKLKEQKEKKYIFNGWQNCAQIKAINPIYKGIDTPLDLYDALSEIWCEYTCAPRLRHLWSKDNKTAGQCSITAFLAQDIFGGEVYSMPTNNGGLHLYNCVNGLVFDLACEQFGNKMYDLVYDCKTISDRDTPMHFYKEEKKARYEYLKEHLAKQ